MNVYFIQIIIYVLYIYYLLFIYLIHFIKNIIKNIYYKKYQLTILSYLELLYLFN